MAQESAEKDKSSEPPFIGPSEAKRASETETITQLNLRDPKARPLVGLPGRVLEAGGKRLGSVIPAMHLALEGRSGGPAKGVHVRFSETDTEATLVAIREIEDRDQIEGFGLVVDFGEHSGGDVVEAAGSDITPGNGLKMSMRAAFLLAEHRKPMLTGAFAVEAVPVQPEYVLEYGDPFGAVFDCHSHWYSQAERDGGRHFTNCHGPCPTTQCHCWGTNSRARWGWRLCKC